jgi:hypothetical protein
LYGSFLEKINRLECFCKEEKNIFGFEMHQATQGVVKIYISGVVTQDRRIGSCFVSILETPIQVFVYALGKY